MADEDTPLEGQVPVDAHPDDGPATIADGALEAPATGVNPSNNLPTEAKDAIPNTTQKLEDDSLSEGENKQDRLCLKGACNPLTVAVEALKQQPPSTDKKTAFWTRYKTLADEFDNDFQKKYGNDLDTSLIFVRYFVFAGYDSLIPDAGCPNLMPQLDTVPPRIVVVAQGLLYFSLLSTLLAALLAVLGKQWLLYYDSVGNRGTVEERGLERQRKFDGLRRWKFDLVMQMFPLLLQFALLLFAAALSIYLWTIHHAIAAIVLALTCLGLTGYAAMTIAALIWEDSPFQTSLGFVVKTVVKGLSRADDPSQLWEHWRRISHLLSQAWSACTRAQKVLKPLLPLFNLNRARNAPTSLFYQPPLSRDEISAAAAAVLWALETSTSPDMPVLRRLHEVFNPCIVGWNTVQDGMADRAIACMKAFAVLELVTDPHQRPQNLWGIYPSSLENANEELQSFNHFFDIFRRAGQSGTLETWELRVAEEPWVITQWILRFIATDQCPERLLKSVLIGFQPSSVPRNIHSTILADFLFCLNSFFSPTMACDRSVLDKRSYEVLLITLLFENMNKRLADKTPLDREIANAVIVRVAELVDRVDSRCVNAAYRFCAADGVSQIAIMSAVQLVNLEEYMLDFNLSEIQAHIEDVGWAYRILDGLDNSERRYDTVTGLLQALVVCGPIQGKLSTSALRTILSALSSPDSGEKLKCTASAVFVSVGHWFNDNELGPILAVDSVWRNLGGLFSNAYHYTLLGDKLSTMPHWKNIISKDLPGWIAQYRGLVTQDSSISIEEQWTKFRSVLSRVWGLTFNATEPEATLSMVFGALAQAWDQIDVSDPEIVLSDGYTLRLLDSTINIMFCARKRSYVVLQHPSQAFLDIDMVRLGDAVGKAGGRANGEMVSGTGEEAAEDSRLWHAMRDLLTKLAFVLHGELRSPPRFEHDAAELAHWDRLEDTCWADFGTLREKISETRPAEGQEKTVDSV
ncbi:hypothetical protein B0H14DRAFT_2683432 [Mycena olivaceomarginata]|nr:hypothetical protein B0H14DRAFT_2683432 [Mycena olivaceomarginata]